MMRQTIDEGIGCAVISLGRIAKNTRDRREHHETIEIHLTRRLVEEPAALGLWSDHRAHPLRREGGERRVVDHHREMENTSQRSLPAFDLLEQSIDVVRRTDVCRNDLHARSTILEIVDKL